MGKGIKQTILKKKDNKNTNGQLIHEEMLNILGHKGNKNQSDIESNTQIGQTFVSQGKSLRRIQFC
jgi:hypothetical protein